MTSHLQTLWIRKIAAEWSVDQMASYACAVTSLFNQRWHQAPSKNERALRRVFVLRALDKRAKAGRLTFGRIENVRPRGGLEARAAYLFFAAEPGYGPSRYREPSQDELLDRLEQVVLCLYECRRGGEFSSDEAVTEALVALLPVGAAAPEYSLPPLPAGISSLDDIDFIIAQAERQMLLLRCAQGANYAAQLRQWQPIVERLDAAEEDFRRATNDAFQGYILEKAVIDNRRAAAIMNIDQDGTIPKAVRDRDGKLALNAAWNSRAREIEAAARTELAPHANAYSAVFRPALQRYYDIARDQVASLDNVVASLG